MPELYLLHPAAIHFPIALLSFGAAVAAWRLWRGLPSGLPEAESWLLWLGTIAAWAAFGLGFLAQKTATHVPAAWQTLNEHKEAAYWTVSLFTALSVWRLVMARGRLPSNRRWNLLFLFAWLISLGALFKTAYHGGELVYTHGMGVQQPE